MHPNDYSELFLAIKKWASEYLPNTPVWDISFVPMSESEADTIRPEIRDAIQQALLGKGLELTPDLDEPESFRILCEYICELEGV